MYTILDRDPPYMIRAPAGQIGYLDFAWTGPVVNIVKEYQPQPLISLLEEPQIDCSAPTFALDGKINLICTNSATPLNGTYTVWDREPPYIVSDPAGQIGYLGFIWTGPVIKQDVRRITVVIKQEPPKPNPPGIIIASVGLMGLGALFLEIAKRLLARAAQRAPGNTQALAYGDRLNDISVRVLSKDDFHVQPNDPRKDWPT